MRRVFHVYILFLTLLLSIPSGLYAGKLEKGFEALSIHNYFEAKEIFEKLLKSDPTGASYGLSLIYTNDKNPFHQLDSALKYIDMAITSYPSEKDKEKDYLKEFGIDALSMDQHKIKVGLLAYRLAKDQLTVTSFNHFVQNYTFSGMLLKAVSSRDSLAFINASNENTHQSYREFLDLYPTAEQYSEANSLYELRLYEDQTKSGLLESYIKFIAEHPMNAHVSVAMDKVYELYITEISVQNYHDFVLKFPENKNVSQAWRTIYNLYNREYSKERIVEFRIDFPDYPFLDELMVDYELSEVKYLPIKQGKLWGFINESGDVMIVPAYDWVEKFSDGLALVGKDFKVGFVNKAGKPVIPLIYDEAESFNQGMAIVGNNDKFGAINKANLVEIPIVYDELNDFNEGMASVQIGEKYGYLDRHGKMLVQPEYDYAGGFEAGFAYVEKDGFYGIINAEGKVIIPVEFDWLENFIGGLARVRKDYKFGMYNSNGELIIPIEFDHLGQVSNGRILAAKEDKCGYYDRLGKEVIPLEYDFAPEVMEWGHFNQGLVKIKRNKLAGIIDTLGKRVLAAMFEDLIPVKGDLIPVKKKGKWGFCDPTLKLKIQYKYDQAGEFAAGFSIVIFESGFGMIDVMDKIIVPFIYEEIIPMENGFFRVKEKGMYGLMDREHKVLLESKYTKINGVEKYFQMEIGEEYFWFNPETDEIFWNSNLGGE